MYHWYELKPSYHPYRKKPHDRVFEAHGVHHAGTVAGRAVAVSARRSRAGEPAATVARRLAGEYGVPSIERNVFLDYVRDGNAVSDQFRRLLDIARREGTALGIGHPHPETLAVLAQELSRMDDYNIQVVPVSRLIEI